MRIDSVRFACSVFRPEDAPEGSDRDVIFVGRSNVGKSSLINRLVGKSGIARVSSTPGRTQSVNFVRVNEAFHLVDFPGYGYARVPEEIRRSWKHLVDGVLAARRRRIVLAVLVMDARHPPSDLDHAMRAWLVENGLPYVVVATKADKIGAGSRTRTAGSLADELSDGGNGKGPPVLLASGKTGLGLREIWKHLERALERPKAAGRRGESWISGS